jgi:PmbA protein
MEHEKAKALSIADDVIRKALKEGCDAAEVYIKTSDGVSVEAKDGAVEAFDSSRDFGIAVKVIRDQRPGFSFTSLPEMADKTVRKAIEATEGTAPDAYMGVPALSQPAEVEILDSAVSKMTGDDVIREALALEDSARSHDRRIKKVRKAVVSLVRGSTTIVNSKGVRVSYDSGYVSASVTPLAEDDRGNSQTGWDFTVCRRRDDMDTKLVGATASERAIELLGSQRITSLRVPVILEPQVAVQFLGILSASLSAEAVLKKRSFLAEKVGRQVISAVIDIIDDGLLPWGIGTRPVDDEGVPKRRKQLLSGGVLKGFLHNSYTAAKSGERSTGNASRRGFKSLPGVAASNLFIAPTGEKNTGVRAGADVSRQGGSLVRSLSRGIIITEAMGLHTANPVSGDFSVGISGILVEHGERAYPIKEAVLSGNILDLFRKVEETGDDLRFYGGTGSPSLLISEMDISA